jgi:hypothetical protein
MGPFSKGWTEDDVEVVIQRNEPDDLLYVPIVVSVNADCLELGWAEEICLKLCKHPHFNVRGNAILGLGHTARRCGLLTLELAVPVIAKGLLDANEFVRNHAYTAASDLNTYLNVIVPGYEEPTWDED